MLTDLELNKIFVDILLNKTNGYVAVADERMDELLQTPEWAHNDQE